MLRALEPAGIALGPLARAEAAGAVPATFADAPPDLFESLAHCSPRWMML
jgi:hypothetical protein